MSPVMGKVARAVADLLIPRKCVVCGRNLLLNENHLCIYCQADIPLTYYWQRKHNPMANRFNLLIQKWLEGAVQPVDLTEEDFLKEGDPETADTRKVELYAYASALFFYNEDSGFSRITQRLKYHGDLPAGRWFGRQLGEKLASTGWFEDVDAVIPVPLHWTRRWSRGYNQAEILAEAVSHCLGAELRTDILRRYRRTGTQTKLAGEAKWHNVKGAFKVCDKVSESIDDYGLAGVRHLLLIDDVFTTGSTLMACFTALRTAFPPSVRISVATLGFVGGG